MTGEPKMIQSCLPDVGQREPIIYEPGTVVQAADFLGGYTGVVLLPEGTFEGSGGWEDVTRIQVTNPGDLHQPWPEGSVVDVVTDFLTPTGGES
jgi:hypothetical protein